MENKVNQRVIEFINYKKTGERLHLCTLSPLSVQVLLLIIILMFLAL